ncbi:MAG: tRNA pseudouridine(55) synthase TruB [Oscillospiraceae bacterium]|jgi:tRNA pseudouridine55 synthase
MNGILLVDKPAGWTSHDVVAKLRGILHERRIGHSGTLDPMATGLLVAFVGRATRAVEFAESDCKEYLAGLRLGITTDTQDITGTVLSQSAPVDRQTAEAVFAQFRGGISQVPPMYSAIKLDGQKLYTLARRGKTVERKPRNITIHKLECIGEQDGDLLLDVQCSKGTYIRTLCHDIGAALGCGGTLSSLRRIQAGVFSVADALTLEQITEAANVGNVESLLLPVDQLFIDVSALTVCPAQEKRCRNGGTIQLDVPDGQYRIYSEAGEFLTLSAVKSGTAIQIKSFFEV